MEDINLLLESIIDLESGIDVVWVSQATYLVFLMQLGFAFLEAGAVRLKNLQSILFKNVVDICMDTIVWWILGYGFAFGETSGNFLGTTDFAASRFKNDHVEYLTWMFQWAFAGAAATIVSGCVAERMPIWGYLCYSMFSIAWIYPVIVHWTWGGGWLEEMGYHDFAGSGIIHMCGGTAGFIATAIMGARIDRFDVNKQEEFKPNNITFCVLGALLLWFSWYGFNCGSTFGAVGGNQLLIPLIGMNTTLAAATGALIVSLIHYIKNYDTKNRYSIVLQCNGFLAGLVAVTASCDSIEPYAAFISGVLGGLMFMMIQYLLAIVKIDDPLDAVPIHGGCGFLGVIFTGFFHKEDGLIYSGSGELLVAQCAGAFSILGWVIVHTIVFMYMLKPLGLLREEQRIEIMGADSWRMGGSAYSSDEAAQKVLKGYTNIMLQMDRNKQKYQIIARLLNEKLSNLEIELDKKINQQHHNFQKTLEEIRNSPQKK